jgi:ABC-type multidrug transport system ATPase subunit
VIEAGKIRKSYGDRLLFEDLSFALPPGGIVGVIGPNGAGKTTLFRMITGQESPDAGALRLGETVKLAYVDQARDALRPNKSVWEEISEGKEQLEIGRRTIPSRAYVASFGFKSADQQKKIGTLSGGERNRVHLACTLKKGGNVLLLDEPTNDLDVSTLGALEEMLVEFGGTALVVTHDRYFLDRVATAILAFEGDGRVVRYAGNHESYRAQRATAEAQRARQQQQARAAAPKKTERTVQRTVRLSHSEERELEGILPRIEEAEAHISRLEARLSDPELYAAGGDARALLDELEQARALAASLMTRWEELETIRSGAG